MHCCSAIKLTYYAQCYVQEELRSVFIYICMNSSLHIYVADDFRKTVLLEYIYE